MGTFSYVSIVLVLVYFPVCMLKVLIVLSSEQEVIQFPSCEKVKSHIPPSCPCKFYSYLLINICQIFTFLSLDPDTKYNPSGEKLTVFT